MSQEPPADGAQGGEVLDRERSRALYDQYWRSLVGYLVEKLGADHNSAEDAVSDVLAKIMEDADKGTPQIVTKDTATYLRVSVKNQYRHEDRKKKPIGVKEHQTLDDNSDKSQRRAPSILIAREMLDKVRARLDALPETERKLLTLVDQDGLEIQEAAVQLGLKSNDAWAVYSRAHRALEEELGKNWSTYILPADSNTYKPRTREGLLKKVEELPPEYRESLRLSLGEGLGEDGLAERLHLSPAATKDLVAKGLAHLQKKTGMEMEEIQAVLRKKLGR
jgi:RNA polymerase sigma factor (sigma-70 family)